MQYHHRHRSHRNFIVLSHLHTNRILLQPPLTLYEYARIIA